MEPLRNRIVKPTGESLACVFEALLYKLKVIKLMRRLIFISAVRFQYNTEDASFQRQHGGSVGRGAPSLLGRALESQTATRSCDSPWVPFR